MTRILQIHSSLSGSDGQSSRLATRFVQRLRALKPDTSLTVRDLSAAPMRHLDAGSFSAFAASADARSAEQRDRVALSDELVAELREADVLVVGVPMYNFGIPSTLKAWFDHVARAGVTFRYTDQGPQGLLTGKRAVLVHTRGGRYAGTAADHLAPHVRQFIGFLGIDAVDEIFAEGLATGDAEAELARAGAELERLATAERVMEAA
ncbi:MAG: FMN-dependent NADH-azoreductase [Candidatus Wenzhouxiangella sp. M2_3B_020]